MKKVIMIAASAATMLFAGADIEPLVDYEVQDVQEAIVEEVKEIKPAPVPVPVVVPAPAPVVCPAPVVKPKNMYVGLDALCGRFETRSGACSCLGDVVAKVGYNFNKYIGIEGRAGYGVTSADHDGGGDSKIKENYGIYLKPQLPLGDKVSLFGLVGYAKAKVESTAGSSTTALAGTLDEDSPSFGLGLEFNINDSWSVVAEGVRLLHGVEASSGTYTPSPAQAEDDINLDTYGLGVNYKF
jgi:hypothetical protein